MSLLEPATECNLPTLDPIQDDAEKRSMAHLPPPVIKNYDEEIKELVQSTIAFGEMQAAKIKASTTKPVVAEKLLPKPDPIKSSNHDDCFQSVLDALDPNKAGDFTFHLDPKHIPDVKNLKFDPFGEDELLLNMKPAAPTNITPVRVQVKYDLMWRIDYEPCTSPEDLILDPLTEGSILPSWNRIIARPFSFEREWGFFPTFAITDSPAPLSFSFLDGDAVEPQALQFCRRDSSDSVSSMLTSSSYASSADAFLPTPYTDHVVLPVPCSLNSVTENIFCNFNEVSSIKMPQVEMA